MNDALTTFYLHLQTHAKDVETRFTALNAKVDANIDHAGAELRCQIEALEESAAKAKTSADASAVVVKKWVDDSMGTVDEWKTKLDIGMLTARAKRADHYANAAWEVALAGVAAAEKAALDAKLAHTDIHSAQAPKIG